MSQTIIACLIVKNEEALLARCLESVKNLDGIWILDTGSQDRTVEIARQYTENVFIDFVWCDAFDLAHNHLLEKVRGKSAWVLSIDADEFLHDVDAVRQAVELAEKTVRVTMVAEGDPNNTFGFPRLFRNTPEIFWVQPIHKHLNVPGEGEPVGNVRITYGYSPAHQRDIDRSLRMLEHTVELEKEPSRNLYYLGREYWYKQKYQQAVDTLQRYVKVSHWDGEEADAYLIMAQAYYEIARADQNPETVEKAAAAVLQALKINANYKEAILFMASIVRERHRDQWLRMAKSANNQDLVWNRVPIEPLVDVYAICPHNDDEALFLSFTLMREKPIVVIVTDSYIQPGRGDVGCEAEIRRQETIDAMALIGCPVVFLGIKDTELTEENLRARLQPFNPFKVYIPALQGGNAQHDLVSQVCSGLWGEKCEHYCTYSKTELYTTGAIEIKPTPAEIEMKNKMLDCYKSQLALPSTRPHFNAVRGRSEWLQ